MVSGFNAAGAWKLERGRPDVVVAILDTGIKWDERGAARPQIHLNTRRAAATREHARRLRPCGDAYDCNGDGVFNVDDYAGDPRVSVTPAGAARRSAGLPARLPRT